MLYAIVGDDLPDSLAQRIAARPAHLARLNELEAAGRLALAGPCPAIDSPDPGPAGFSGSLIVAEFDSLDAAQVWADADLDHAAKCLRQVAVHRLEQPQPVEGLTTPYRQRFSSAEVGRHYRERLEELWPKRQSLTSSMKANRFARM